MRSFHVQRVTILNIKPILKEHVEIGTNIQTDEHPLYHWLEDYPDHDVVTHKRKEYSRYENGRHITTNTVEGYFGLVKRGIYGVYHHVGRGYLQQYLNEFDLRYNNRRMKDSELTLRGAQSHRREAAHTTGTKSRFAVNSGKYRWQSRLL